MEIGIDSSWSEPIAFPAVKKPERKRLNAVHRAVLEYAKRNAELKLKYGQVPRGTWPREIEGDVAESIGMKRTTLLEWIGNGFARPRTPDNVRALELLCEGSGRSCWELMYGDE